MYGLRFEAVCQDKSLLNRLMVKMLIGCDNLFTYTSMVWQWG